MSKTALEILIDARKLIERPEDWVSHIPTRSGCHCAVTAINSSAGLDVKELLGAAWALEKSIGTVRIARWNDTHTHAEVLAGFDKAIAAERVKAEGRS